MKRRFMVVGLFIIFLFTIACEPSPKISPIGNYEVIKIVDKPSEDILYPQFFEENEIIFCSEVLSGINYALYQTDTLGEKVTTIFDEQSVRIEGFPQIDGTGMLVAYTVEEYKTVDLENKAIRKYYPMRQPEEEDFRKPSGVLHADIYVYNTLTDSTQRLTYNGHSHFVRWLGQDSLLVLATTEDSLVYVSRCWRTEGGGTACGDELRFHPSRYQVIRRSSGRILKEFPLHGELYISEKPVLPLNQESIVTIKDSVSQVSFLYNSQDRIYPFPYYWFAVQDDENYHIVWADSNRIIFAHLYKDDRDWFKEKISLIAVGLHDYQWKTIVKGVPAGLLGDISIGADRILTIDGKYRIGEVNFDGSGEYFLQVNSAVGIRGISASPSGRLFVVSAWVGKDGYNLYLIKRKQD